jgi:hypothetical protein
VNQLIQGNAEKLHALLKVLRRITKAVVASWKEE